MSERYTGGLVYNPPGGWSAQFSGSNYLSVASNAANALGSGDFTVQLWFYLTGTTGVGSSGEIGLIGCGDTTSSRYTIRCQGTSTRIMSWWLNTPSNNVTGTTPIALNTWYHAALVRSGSSSNNVKLYLNGKLESQGTSTYNSPADNISIGRGYPNLAGEYTNGYISNLQIVVGTALYSGSFTPPTGASLPVTNTALLTCRYPTIVDGSTNNFTITNTGTVTVNTSNPFPTSVLPNPALGGAGNGIYTMSQYAALLKAGTWPAYDPYYKNVTLNLHGNGGAVPPFNSDASTNNFQVTQVGDTRPSNLNPFVANGYWSTAFNGTSSFLSMTGSSATNFSGVDWTVETWVYSNGAPPADYTYIIQSQTGANSWLPYLGIALMVNGTINCALNAANYTSTQTINFNAWNHLAMVRSGGVVKLYINGVASSVSATVDINNSNLSFWFGKVDNTPGGGSYIYYLNGYMSNTRFVKGTAVYTSNFTVPTTPLTAITNTTLLINQSSRFIDNSTSAFTITPSGSAAVNQLQPFTAQTLNSYGYGAYFDGSGDYLNSPNVAFASSNFTIEGWFYPTTIANLTNFWGMDNGSGSTPKMIMYINSSGNLTVDMGNAGTTQFPVSASASTYLQTNAWNHIAVVRSGTGSSQFVLYINGTNVSSGQLGTNISSITATFNIGYIGEAYGQMFSGYVSNFRVVNGTAVYTSNFTPNTTPLTAITNTSLLTVQTNVPSQNNTFLDSSTNNFTITRNGNTTQGTFTPYGSNWSNYFGGGSNYLDFPSNAAYGMGTGDFTIEAWLYPTAAWAGAGSYNPIFLVNGTGGLYFGQNSAGFGLRQSGTANIISYGTSPTLNTWTHVAIVRSGTTVTMYYNGTSVATATSSANFTSGTLTIANDGSYGIPAQYISNLRIVKGTAVYTTGFTPSTAPLTAISGTSLLVCQSNRFVDNSSNAAAITVTGSPSVQRFSPFSPSTAYSTSVIGGSGYFDGSGDYLTIPANTIFRQDQGDWTLEGWFYVTSFATNCAFLSMGTYVSVDNFTAYSTTSGKVGYEAGTGGWAAAANYETSANTISLNSWTHIAWVRSSGSLFIYVNGTRLVNQAAAAFGVGSTNALYIGDYFGQATSNAAPHYQCDVRFVKGTALYTGATLTVPTAPLTAVANTSYLLGYTNAGILDNAMMNDLETVGNAQISTSVKKYGSASMYFPYGVATDLTMPSRNNLDLSTGDFTMEFWAYYNSFGTDRKYFLQVSGGSYWQLVHDTSFGISLRVTGYSAVVNQGSNSGWSTGTWYHVALVRSGSAFTIYRNGVSIATGTSASSLGFYSPTYIGGYDSTTAIDAYLDDFRITKGVARYTANFTPPTSQLQDQ